MVSTAQEATSLLQMELSSPDSELRSAGALPTGLSVEETEPLVDPPVEPTLEASTSTSSGAGTSPSSEPKGHPQSPTETSAAPLPQRSALSGTSSSSADSQGVGAVAAVAAVGGVLCLAAVIGGFLVLNRRRSTVRKTATAQPTTKDMELSESTWRDSSATDVNSSGEKSEETIVMPVTPQTNDLTPQMQALDVPPTPPSAAFTFTTWAELRERAAKHQSAESTFKTLDDVELELDDSQSASEKLN